jgi:hypothetical protein
MAHLIDKPKPEQLQAQIPVLQSLEPRKNSIKNNSNRENPQHRQPINLSTKLSCP